MKIRLSRENLLLQIDEQSPKPDSLPEIVILDGVMVNDSDLWDEFDKTFPGIVMTPTDKAIFQQLWLAKPNVVPARALFTLIQSGRPISLRGEWGASNTIAVHIKTLRKSLAKNKLPYVITTVRSEVGWGKSTGGYLLEPK